VDDLLIDARALAEFSNIDSPERFDYFRNNYPDFLPNEVWDTPGAVIPPGAPPESGLGKAAASGLPLQLWMLHQRVLRIAWEKKFPLDNCVSLIAAIENISQYSRAVQEVVEQTIRSNTIPKYSLPKHEVWPFQRAVMFMAVNSWRARFCIKCGKRFVAAKPKNTYCSDDCFKESRKGAKRAWWSEHGQAMREAKAKQSKTRRKK
jgi:hypothetical protein